MNVTLNSVNIVEYTDDEKKVSKWSEVNNYEVNYAKSFVRLFMNNGSPLMISLNSTTYTNMAELEAAVLGFMDVDARAFKIYTALLNQELVSLTEGTLTVGNTYIIETVETGDDFDNCGFVAAETPFVATEETPTAWTASTVVVDMTASSPVPTILENTLGDIVWTYNASGEYTATLDDAFVDGKTVHDPVYAVGEISSDVVLPSDIVMTLSDDGLLVNTKFEVKVYN